MKKLITLTGLSFMYAALGLAQSPVFSKNASTYVRLNGATQHMKDSVWDDPSDWKPAEKNLSLGFNFKAFGRNINTFLWEQGAIEFRDGDTVIKIGLDADLCDYGFGTKTAKSPMYYKKEGSAGNYIMKLEWRSFGFWDDWDNNGKCVDSANLQIWIYQNPQKVVMHFGPKNVNNFAATFPSKMPLICAKFDGVGNTSGMALNGDPSNPATFPFADTGTRGLTAWPAANQMYIFDFSLTDKVNDYTNPQFQAYFNQSHLVDPLAQNGDWVQIYSAEGKNVLQGQFFDYKAPISALQPGIYFTRWNSMGQERRLKILITESNQ